MGLLVNGGLEGPFLLMCAIAGTKIGIVFYTLIAALFGWAEVWFFWVVFAIFAIVGFPALGIRGGQGSKLGFAMISAYHFTVALICFFWREETYLDMLEWPYWIYFFGYFVITAIAYFARYQFSHDAYILE